MKTEDDRTIEEHGKRSHEAGFDAEEAPMTTEAEPENGDGPGHDAPLPSEPDLILDERLTSAAAPFLYMLSLALIAVAGNFVYLFFHG
jgi:hypothetical protein